MIKVYRLKAFNRAMLSYNEVIFLAVVSQALAIRSAKIKQLTTKEERDTGTGMTSELCRHRRNENSGNSSVGSREKAFVAVRRYILFLFQISVVVPG